MSRPERSPERALIYHFTHIDNMVSILAAGRLVADNLAGAGLVADVGDTEVKAARRGRVVPCLPGGVVADYVPFYFAPRSPMLYRIACDHRVGIAGRYPGGEDPLVYLVSSVDRVAAAGLAWVASDGNCAALISRFTTALADLSTYVDWPLMREEIWKNTTEDPDRRRRRMAEFLVHQELPLDLVAGYVTRTGDRRRQLCQVLQAAGASDAYVDVRPNWYYGLGPGEVAS